MHITPSLLAVLSQTPLFEGISQDNILHTLQFFIPCEVSKGEFLFYQGDTASRMFILLSGGLKVIQSTPDGKQVVLRLIQPGGVFGCVAALSQGLYPGSAEATQNSRCLYLGAGTIAALMKNNPALAYNAFQLMVKRLHELQDRYRELATENVEKRLIHTLLRLMEQSGRKQKNGSVLLDLPLSRQHLAEMSGTTLYTVSRFLQKWVQQGLIQASRERVTLLNPDLLYEQGEEI